MANSIRLQGMSEEASVERLMSADPEEEVKSQSDGGEKEYEIEAILESKRNMFGAGSLCYFDPRISPSY